MAWRFWCRHPDLQGPRRHHGTMAGWCPTCQTWTRGWDMTTTETHDSIEVALRLSEAAGLALMRGQRLRAAALYREAAAYARTPEGRRVLEEQAAAAASAVTSEAV